METMIDLIDVTKSYGKGLPAVNHANLHVDKGEFVFVVGPPRSRWPSSPSVSTS